MSDVYKTINEALGFYYIRGKDYIANTYQGRENKRHLSELDNDYDSVRAFKGFTSIGDFFCLSVDIRTPENEAGNFIYAGDFLIKDLADISEELGRVYNTLIKAESKKDYSRFTQKQQEQIQEKFNSKFIFRYSRFRKFFDLQTNQKIKSDIQKEMKNSGFDPHGVFKPDSVLYLEGVLSIRETIQRKYSNDIKGYMKFMEEYHPLAFQNFFLRELRALLPMSAIFRHSYIVAKTGSGKSELLKMLVFNEILQHKPNKSVIVIDPHGDLVEEIARFKQFSVDTPEVRDRLVYIDPHLQDGYTPSINPFDIESRDEKTISSMTQELMSIISTLLKGASQTAQMEAILSPCIAVLLRRKGSSFADLQRFMDDENNSDLVALGRNSPNPQHAQIFQSKFHDDQYRATKHGIYTRMQILLNDPTFQRIISGKSTLNLRQLIDDKKIILFKLSLGQSGGASMEAYGRFIVGMLRIIGLQRQNLPKGQYKVPALTYIDEFHHFVSPDIETALTGLRKYGIHFTLCHQFIGQGDIDTALQKALFSTGVQFIGANETSTLKRAEQELNIPLEELKKLKKGEFYIKCNDSSHACKIQVPSLLVGDNNSMTDEEWEELKKYSLRYYQKIEDINHVQSEIIEEDNSNKPSDLSPKYKL